MDRPAAHMRPAVAVRCAADRAQARTLAARAARDWTVGEVHGWFGRVSTAETGRPVAFRSRPNRPRRVPVPSATHLELMATGACRLTPRPPRCSPSSSPGACRTTEQPPARSCRVSRALLLDRVLQDPTGRSMWCRPCVFWPAAAGRCLCWCSRHKMTRSCLPALRGRGPGRVAMTAFSRAHGLRGPCP
jgi:hypothetical protein